MGNGYSQSTNVCVFRSRYTEVETVGQSSEMFISTPLTVGGTRFHGGVWDAYGAQTVMGCVGVLLNCIPT